jgi:anti-anti-sigma factor
MRTFRLAESDRRSGRRLLKIEGDLDLAVADQLSDALDRAKDCREVWIDLRECDFVDSTALAIYVHEHNRMRDQGRRLFLYHPTAQVERLLERTGLMRDGLVLSKPRLDS